MRFLKTRLAEQMLPSLRIFLDLDDLDEGRGADAIDMSQCVLCFLTKGFFDSKVAHRPSAAAPRTPINRADARVALRQNCIRELLRALLRAKPIVLMLETDIARNGGVPKAEVWPKFRHVFEQLITRWELDAEVERWRCGRM